MNSTIIASEKIEYMFHNIHVIKTISIHNWIVLLLGNKGLYAVSNKPNSIKIGLQQL